MREPQFAKEDVYAVAKAILDDWVYDGGDYPDACRYCWAEFKRDNTITHAPNCEVLVARDLLTGESA